MHRQLSATFTFLMALAALVLGAVGDQARAQDKKLAEKIATWIAVLGDPEAAGETLEETQRAIKELVAIGKPAVPQILQAMRSKNLIMASYSALVLDETGRSNHGYRSNGVSFVAFPDITIPEARALSATNYSISARVNPRGFSTAVLLELRIDPADRWLVGGTIRA